MPNLPPALIRHQPLLLFDGVCNLCNATVQFCIRHDRRARLRFAPLQSATGQVAMHAAHLTALNTVLLVADDRVWTKSDAVLRLTAHFGGLWRLAAVGWLVPRPLRNGVYDWIACHRYRWFGKQDQCMLPSPHLQARFVTDASD